MKILPVPETKLSEIVKQVSTTNTWKQYEMVVVKDADYDEAVNIISAHIPNDNRLRILEVLYAAD